MRRLIIGSRGSPLALCQSKLVQELVEGQNPGLATEIRIIRTTGDQTSRAGLAGLAGSTKGLFVKEIQEALLGGGIDLAVHSLKDLPGESVPGLSIAAIPAREDPRDALVSSADLPDLDALPEGAKVGTGSPRREVQLRLLRRDLDILPVRGNVGTRIQKVGGTEGLDAVVLAAAGLRRLGLGTRISYAFSVEEMIPAVGLGALAVEVRSDDRGVRDLLRPLDDRTTRQCTAAERSFLQTLGGGCQAPIAGHAFVSNGTATFTAFVADPATLEVLRRTRQGKPEDLESLALRTAQDLLSLGASEILKRISPE